MQRRITNPHKGGPCIPTGTPVCPTSDGSLAADRVSKIRALAEAMGGPCIVRDTDGNGFLLTVEALKFIPLSHIGAGN